MVLRPLIPALGWALLILVAVSLPPGNIPRTGIFSIPHFDKLVHLILFAIWGWILFCGLRKQKPGSVLQQHPVLLALAAGLAYAILTELFQHFFLDGRQGSIFDVLADLFGTVFGVLGIQRLEKGPLKFFI